MNLNLMGRLKDNQVSGSLGAIISICILFAHQSFRNVLANAYFFIPLTYQVSGMGRGQRGESNFI